MNKRAKTGLNAQQNTKIPEPPTQVFPEFVQGGYSRDDEVQGYPEAAAKANVCSRCSPEPQLDGGQKVFVPTFCVDAPVAKVYEPQDHADEAIDVGKDIVRQDNEFLLTGYRYRRRPSNSYKYSLKSIFAVYNETVNIWSHLLGAIFFAFVYQYVVLSKGIRTQYLIAFSVYNLSVTVCFIFSTIFHTFSDHSQGMRKFGSELDHLGIVLVTWGTGMSGTNFAFYQDEFLRNTYIVILSGTALGCAVFTYSTTCTASSRRASLPRWSTDYGSLEGQSWRLGWSPYLGLALINFTGAAVHVARIPERWSPRTFDLLG
ncbi:hemolysin-III related-domain-containing protein [Hypoxylon crocopeplum]|nr:hemolysin-III related-domain-containing protein [Hypoxylon crocopeplum]